MKQHHIESSIGNSKILVGESIDNLHEYLPKKKTAIITDTNLARIYGHKFPEGVPVLEIGTGEDVKTLQTVSELLDKLVELEFDRSSFILAIGGGIVCDIAGFVASIYMRGIEFGFVSTTLLSQVDASVGGKNGVNFQGFKNMVGVFGLPNFVICDMGMLSTLPQDDLQCGYAEIIKHGLIASPELFSFIENNLEKAINLDSKTIERFVYDSVLIKSEIVNKDARENGDRRKLNFGHTFGHAVEKVCKLPHGKAVAIGMVVACKLSIQRGLLSPAIAERLKELLLKMGLPVTINIDPEKAIAAMVHDKKRSGDVINFVLLRSIGDAVVQQISIDELKAIIYDMCLSTEQER
jgi:3-dehydroquinate synthase